MKKLLPYLVAIGFMALIGINVFVSISFTNTQDVLNSGALGLVILMDVLFYIGWCESKYYIENQ